MKKRSVFLSYCGAIILLYSLFGGDKSPTLKYTTTDIKQNTSEQNSDDMTNAFDKSFKRLSVKRYTRDRTKVDLFTDWLQNSHVICDNDSHVGKVLNCSLVGSLTGYPGFIHMKNVLVDTSRFLDKDPGCTRERVECWGLRPGFFQVRFYSCSYKYHVAKVDILTEVTLRGII